MIPSIEGLAAQQQIDRLSQPFLHHGNCHLVREREKPPGVLESVPVILLILYDAVERHEFASVSLY